jgi:hypothetical protein
VELLDVVPAFAMIALALYCFRLAPRQPLRVQKRVMAAAGMKCVLFAGILFAALFGSDAVREGVHGAFWFLAKVGAYIYCFMWFRFTFPRYRFDQLMRLSWQFLIPLGLVNVIGVAVAIVLRERWDWNPFFSLVPTTIVTLGFAAWLTADKLELSGTDEDIAAESAAVLRGSGE